MIDKAIADVIQERKDQDQEWGGPDHDDNHSPVVPGLVRSGVNACLHYSEHRPVRPCDSITADRTADPPTSAPSP